MTGWGKNGPAYFFPGERMGRPILSPGKKLTGGKFRPVTPGSSLKHFVIRIPLSLPRSLLFSSTDGFEKTLSHCLQNGSHIVVIAG